MCWPKRCLFLRSSTLPQRWSWWHPTCRSRRWATAPTLSWCLPGPFWSWPRSFSGWGCLSPRWVMRQNEQTKEALLHCPGWIRLPTLWVNVGRSSRGMRWPARRPWKSCQTACAHRPRTFGTRMRPRLWSARPSWASSTAMRSSWPASSPRPAVSAVCLLLMWNESHLPSVFTLGVFIFGVRLALCSWSYAFNTGVSNSRPGELLASRISILSCLRVFTWEQLWLIRSPVG